MFKPKPYPKRPRQPLMIPEVPPEPKAVISRADGGMGAVEKFDYVRSKPLMEAYRRLACQHCGKSDGTVVGAHSNMARHGKGRSIKASDIYCASLCFGCHTEVDSGDGSQEERETAWKDAHIKTMDALIALSWEPGEHRLRALLTKVGIVKA